MNNNNHKNKVNFFWVLIVFIVTASMAYSSGISAKTVRQLYKQQNLEQRQQELDFPVLQNWEAGNFEQAVWVDPDQTLSPIYLPEVAFDTPEYKLNLNSRQPQTLMTSHNRIYRNVAKIKLFTWDW